MKKQFDVATKATEAINAPLVEILDDKRVLIENHQGLTEYSNCRITVKVRFGCICVAGTSLQLAVMTKERMVITGKIACVELNKGGR